MTALFSLTDLFFLGAIFCSFIATYLLWKNASNTYLIANRTLASFFFITGYCILGYIIISTKIIAHLPFLYKTAAPLNYLYFPLGFLYLRIVLNNENRFTLKDLIHFLPFVISVIDLLPFYFMPIDQKAELVHLMLNDNRLIYMHKDGIFPIGIHYFIRLFQGLIYLSLMWRQIYIHNKNDEGFYKSYYLKQFVEVKKWLLHLTSMMSLLYIGSVLLVLYVAINKTIIVNDITILLSSILMSASMLILAVKLLINPLILYGIPYLSTKPIRKNEVQLQKNSAALKEAQLQDLPDWTILHQQIINNKIYLQTDLNIESLAHQLKLSSRVLSFIINYNTSSNFKNYINKLRVTYVIEQLHTNIVKNKTIESIGLDAGFGSRSSFFLAFKFHIGCTPTEYIQSIHEGKL